MKGDVRVGVPAGEQQICLLRDNTQERLLRIIHARSPAAKHERDSRHGTKRHGQVAVQVGSAAA